MNEMLTRNYESMPVRIIQRDGEVWFAAKDVSAVLGLTTRKIREIVPEDERTQSPLIDTLGREQKTTMVSESGLYTLIMRSDKPEAKRFQRWVTGEVLPSIRRTGSYCPGLPAGVLAASERRLRLMAQRYAAFVRYELRSRIMDLRGLTPDMVSQLAMEAAEVKATYSGFEQTIWDNAPVSDEFVQRVADLEEKGKLGWMQCVEWR